MKKIYLLTFSLFALSQVNAQTYTLTQTNSEPVVGDSYGALPLDTNMVTLPMSISGTGVTWSILNVIPANTVTVNSYSAAASFSNAANYPGTNLVQTDSSTTTYFKTTPNKLELLGVDAGFFDLNYNTNTATIANYPMSYGYSATDLSIGGTMNVPQFSLSGPFTGSMVTTVDGSGTLDLNGVTVLSNCLRVKSTQNISFSLTFGALTGTIDQTMYNYYHSSSKFPVLSVNYSHIVTAGLQTLDQYQTQVSTLSNIAIGIKENKGQSLSFKAFPNPANTQVNLQFVLTNSDTYTIEILNNLGQIVKALSLSNMQPGLYNETINIADLSAGMYTIKVTGKTIQGTEKLMIQK